MEWVKSPTLLFLFYALHPEYEGINQNLIYLCVLWVYFLHDLALKRWNLAHYSFRNTSGSYWSLWPRAGSAFQSPRAEAGLCFSRGSSFGWECSHLAGTPWTQLKECKEMDEPAAAQTEIWDWKTTLAFFHLILPSTTPRSVPCSSSKRSLETTHTWKYLL